MSHLFFGSTSLWGRLVLAGPVLLAFAAPAAHAQRGGFHARPMVTPSMMNSTMMRNSSMMRMNTTTISPAMTRMNTTTMTPAMTRMNTTTMTPAMMRMNTTTTTPAMMAARTNALLRRDIRLDSLVNRNLRLDILSREFGRRPWWGGNQWWGGSMMGGTWGGGGGAFPIVVPSGVGATGTSVAQAPSKDTEDTAKAALLLEQAVAERLANRRRAFDEYQYERDKTPTPEQELLSRSRTNPSRNEVVSGQALNALLEDLRPLGARIDSKWPNALLPLDWREMKHINVTRGTGSIGILKEGGRITWPAALTGSAFQDPRERLAARAIEAVRQASRDNGVDPRVIREMAAGVDQLRTILRQEAKRLTFEPYTNAREFLQRFDDALVALRQPDAANYFNGTYDLKSQTVLGLVKEMNDLGVRFAPAAPEDEPAYAALREALAACDRAAIKPSTVR